MESFSLRQTESGKPILSNTNVSFGLPLKNSQISYSVIKPILNIVFSIKSGLLFLVGGRDNIFGAVISGAHERKINMIAKSLYNTSIN